MEDRFNFIDLFEALVETAQNDGNVKDKAKETVNTVADDVTSFYADSDLDVFDSDTTGEFETFVSVFNKILEGDLDSALVFA